MFASQGNSFSLGYDSLLCIYGEQQAICLNKIANTYLDVFVTGQFWLTESSVDHPGML